jgi:adenylosuccinate lyase
MRTRRWRTSRCGTSGTSATRAPERIILPDATIVLDYMLVRMTGLIEGLVVRSERMRENITRGLGLHASSRVLVALVEKAGIGRDEAYAIVQRAALRAADERAPLRDLLAIDPVVAQKLPLADLDACFDEATFLRNVHQVIARLDALTSSSVPPPTEPSHADG